MKGRKGPIAHAPDVPVLHWIDVAIFDMAAIVFVIPDQVLPETALPDAAFTAFATILLNRSVFGMDLENTILMSRQRTEKSASSAGSVQMAVNVIGQYDEGVNSKWMALARAACCLTQRFDLLGQKSAATIEEIGRKEPARARHKRATIIGHVGRPEAP